MKSARAPKRPNPSTPCSLHKGRVVGYLHVDGGTYAAGRRAFKAMVAASKAARRAAFRAAKRAAL